MWIDYEAAVSLHRVIVGKPAERRHARLASPTPLDNRISYGCINVPASFHDRIVAPAFNGTPGGSSTSYRDQADRGGLRYGKQPFLAALGRCVDVRTIRPAASIP